MTANDDFDKQSFRNWLRTKELALPTSEDELRHLSSLQVRFPPSHWSDDIDWDEYHASAKELLPDPLFWDCVDECAPHGSDEGSNALEDLRGWKKERPRTKRSREYYRDFVAANESFLDESAYRMTILGMAFAYLKLEGWCPRELYEQCLRVIEDEKNLIPTGVIWSSSAEARLRALALCEGTLQSLPKALVD